MAQKHALWSALRVMAFTGVVIPANTASFGRDLPPLTECISEATVLPLLGGVGDSPLAEAEHTRVYPLETRIPYKYD